MEDVVEDIRYVVFEFLSDIYEQCSSNETVTKLLTNCLLNYCYIPLVMPSLIGTAHKSNNQIGISTALYVTTMTFRYLKSKEL